MAFNSLAARTEPASIRWRRSFSSTLWVTLNAPLTVAASARIHRQLPATWLDPFHARESRHADDGCRCKAAIALAGLPPPVDLHSLQRCTDGSRNSGTHKASLLRVEAGADPFVAASGHGTAGFRISVRDPVPAVQGRVSPCSGRQVTRTTLRAGGVPVGVKPSLAESPGDRRPAWSIETTL